MHTQIFLSVLCLYKWKTLQIFFFRLVNIYDT